jgi:hypothetical protein
MVGMRKVDVGVERLDDGFVLASRMAIISNN